MAIASQARRLTPNQNIIAFLAGMLGFLGAQGERWSKAVGPDGKEGGCSEELIEAVRMFRLNAKHLDVEFEDGSRWEWKP